MDFLRIWYYGIFLDKNPCPLIIGIFDPRAAKNFLSNENRRFSATAKGAEK
jgi:hypothetical protein